MKLKPSILILLILCVSVRVVIQPKYNHYVLAVRGVDPALSYIDGRVVVVSEVGAINL